MVVLSVLGALLLFLGLVRYLEKTSLFYPSRVMSGTPHDAGMAFEEVYFSAEDGVRLHGWFIPAPSARLNLLYFHGNAGNISGRVDKIALLRTLGFNVLVFDYRGYGRSAGKPSELGLYRDGRAAYDLLAGRKDVGRLPIVLYGASLGGAVAVDVATHRRPAALITEETFTNAGDMARVYYPVVPTFLLSLRLDSDRKLASIICPKLFIHSPQDEIVPMAVGRKLFAAAAGPKEFLEVEGGHNEIFFRSADKVKAGIQAFLARHGL